MRRWIAFLAAAVLTLSLLTACTPAQSAEEEPLLAPGEEETEEEAAPIQVSTFTLPCYEGQTVDPVTCSDGVQWTLSTLLYEGLFRLTPGFEAEELLCDSYTYDAARRSYSFHLRDGVAFSDGSDLTARDVVATLKRAMQSERYRTRLSGISSLRADGSGNVVIVLKTDNAAFPALLDVPIVKAGTESSAIPAGTGPYLYITQQKGDYLQRNDAWWQGKKLPLEHIALSEVKDSDTASYQFSAYEIQLLTSDLTGSDPISTTGSVCLTEADTTVLQYIGFNLGGVFSDPALRRAVSSGIDRGGIVGAYLSDHAKAAQFPVSPVSPLYPVSQEKEYSSAAFGQAMDAAGYGDGGEESVGVTLLVNEESTHKTAIAGAVAAALSSYQLSVSVRSLPWEQYVAALQSGSYDLYYAEARLTADWNLTALIGTGGSLNYGRYSDENMDRLLALYLAGGSANAMSRLCSYFAREMPIVPICFKSTSVLTQQSVLSTLTPTAATPFYGMESWDVQLSS